MQSEVQQIEAAIEAALSPSEFIGYQNSSSFITDIEDVRDRVEALVPAGEPVVAASLYETFIAGCYAKADEVDDSDGEFALFVVSLVEGWVKARQAAHADAVTTAEQLVTWIRTDEYGFMNDVEREAVRALDRSGLTALKDILVAELAKPIAGGHGDAAGRAAGWRRCTRDLLKAVCVCEGAVDDFVALCEADGLTPHDCEVVAELHRTRRRHAEALAWVERGLILQQGKAPTRSPGFGLEQMHRDMLRSLGRSDEALDAAWAAFAAAPSGYTYDVLMREVPRDDANAWRAKALDHAEARDLGAFIMIATKTREWDRLATRVVVATTVELEGLSHSVTEPAAEGLAMQHPGAAARLFEALGMRILIQKKSAYYAAALRNFEHAKRGYESAGESARWATVVATVRRDHARKSGFMPWFERLVMGSAVHAQASFLAEAKDRWRAKTRGR
jgi:hypothetical protein